jgi:hypothetical protein
VVELITYEGAAVDPAARSDLAGTPDVSAVALVILAPGGAAALWRRAFYDAGIVRISICARKARPRECGYARPYLLAATDKAYLDPQQKALDYAPAGR